MLRRLLLSTCLAVSVVAPATAQDASDFVVRLNRIENQSRMMAGQIETLQYENRQLKEQLRKFQEDVEFRLNEGKGGGRAAPAPAGSVNGGNPGAGRPQKRGDAFDPEQNRGQPGAPMQLGTTQPSPPAVAPSSVPAAPGIQTRRVPQPAVDEGEDMEMPAAPGYDEPVDLSPPARVGTTGALSPVPQGPTASVAATGTGDAAGDYATAYEHIKGKRYEQAEMSLRQFIQSHPRDGHVPAATYWLGESYLQRSRNREAAEQFLKVSTDYARSAQAPDAMLKLGASLNALGAREQACATLAELERKFPAAGTNVRQGVVREQKRARCTA